MLLYPEFFNDVFGPVMQPGSSSHTAGPCRLGYLAQSLLGEPVKQAHFLMDRNSSFAGAFGIMAEDIAMLAGVLGMLPADRRLYAARQIAKAQGIEYSYEFGDVHESQHPNAIKFTLSGKSGKTVTLVGDSTGGGMVQVKTVNNYPMQKEGQPCWCKGDAWVLLLFDPQGAVASEQTQRLASSLAGLVEVGMVDVDGQGRLHYLRLAAPPDQGFIQATWPGLSAALLEPVLPVITRPDRKPQLFDTMTGWRAIASERNQPLWEIAVQYEMDASCWTREQVIEYMRMIARTMHRQVHAPYEEQLKAPPSPFKPDLVGAWSTHMASPRRLTDDITAHTIMLANGAGAGIPGIEVVAGPMGGGGGYIYAALYALAQARGFSSDDLLRGLFIAAGLGAIAFSRTEPTGEVIGCTGECGVCGAMAAAGIVEMAGGTPQQVENAASLSLQAALGMPCDPIPGGFGQPCRSRILTATCMASVFADLALSGRQAVLPFHEAIDAADAIGRRLPPELLCTSLGGAAAAPAAKQQAIAFREWYEETERLGTPRPPGNVI